MAGHYWLFKSEPGEYSIDDLASAKGQKVRWDGIRNYQARNFIRDDIEKGDLLFFYHSSCKETGIVGICQIDSAPYPDPTQFDTQSDYYDEKSTPDKPKWFSVDIVLKKKYADVVHTKSLKDEENLTNMVLFKNPRLSVQPVTAREWQLVERLAS